MKPKVFFKIYDLVSKDFYGIYTTKNKADIKLLGLMKQHPARKFYIKMSEVTK